MVPSIKRPTRDAAGGFLSPTCSRSVPAQTESRQDAITALFSSLKSIYTHVLNHGVGGVRSPLDR
jgi:hypothetical protein